MNINDIKAIIAKDYKHILELENSNVNSDINYLIKV